MAMGQSFYQKLFQQNPAWGRTWYEKFEFEQVIFDRLTIRRKSVKIIHPAMGFLKLFHHFFFFLFFFKWAVVYFV